LTVSLTNGSALTLGGIAITIDGANSGDFTQSNNCGTSLPALASCSINVQFQPTATGGRTAAVQIATADGPLSIALSGAGVNPSANDFAITVASDSTTVKAGQTASYALQLTATGSKQGVSLTCTGAPSAATCTVTPATVTVTPGTAAPFTVNVTTTARSATGGPVGLFVAPKPVNVLLALRVLALLPFAFLYWWKRSVWKSRAQGEYAVGFRRLAVAGCLLLAVVVLPLAMSGCGGGSKGTTPPPGTPAGTLMLTVTGTSNGATKPHSKTLTLIVQ
jgi:hypothetical protein